MQTQATPAESGVLTSRLIRQWNSAGLATYVTTTRAPARSGVPAATYRLQFSPEFGFSAARAFLPFLRELGITEIYASPIFQARKGSSHGYDVTNPLRLNPELGSEREFEMLAGDLKRHGMGLILDVVPNHMAASEENPWWFDVLEEGPASPHARYFDIDWSPPTPGCHGKLMLAVLGKPYRKTLESGELRAGLDAAGLHVRYWERRLPLSLASYRKLLEDASTPAPLAYVLDEIGASPKSDIKARLWAVYNSRGEVRDYVDSRLRAVNGNRGDAGSYRELDRILNRQAYRLSYWRTGAERINYRRFFDINDLVGVRVEDEEVFGATHALLLRLIGEGKVSGIRVDHIDGLRDPVEYLRRLERCVRERGAKVYTVIEKVLLNGETVPEEWPVSGTTGYDFLDCCSALFVDGANLDRLGEIYTEFTGVTGAFGEIVAEQKKRVLDRLFSGELRALAEKLQSLAARDRQARERPAREFAAVLREATANVPVYRTYVRRAEVSPRDRTTIEETLRRSANPDTRGPVLDFLRRVILLEYPEWLSVPERGQWLDFVMQWQQLTGPVMAKGMEDTACYVYNRLISLNVVGGAMRPVSVDEFHRFNLVRGRLSPGAMNATSTHDTKRSEDVRARINVLSELPEFWSACLARWSGWNRGRKRPAHGAPAPHANDEILIYQALLGAWPFEQAEVPAFKQRMKAFVVKAAREAKVHTSWLSPDAGYEQALQAFVESILTPGGENRFLPDFLSVQRSLAPFGAIGSLAQALLKIGSPGVPDFYQGTLLWDFSLVDPDNRRPVDFSKRVRSMAALRQLEGEDPIPLVSDLVENWTDGRIKMYLVWKALEFRSRHNDVFISGDYIPLSVSGAQREHVAAFARRHAGQWAVIVVPRLLAQVDGLRNPFEQNVRWGNTTVELPADAPMRWRNVFTGESVGRLSVADLLRRFPVAMLTALHTRSGMVYGAR